MQTDSKTLALSVTSSNVVQYNVGAEEVLATQANKPFRFPDIPMVVIPNPSSTTAPFAWYSGSTGLVIPKTTGPLTFPSKNWPSTGFIKTSNGNLIGLPTTINGNPLGYIGAQDIYQFTSTKWVMFLYMEEWPGGNSIPFRSHMGMLATTDGGTTWTWMGRVLSGQYTGALPAGQPMGIGASNVLIEGNRGTGAVGNYFYTWYIDYTSSDYYGTGRVSLARALVSDVLAWIDGGSAVSFKKWDGSGFTGDGFTGLGAALSGVLWTGVEMQVSYNSFLGRYLMVYAAGGTGWPDIDICLQDSADGLVWNNSRNYMFTTPGRYEAKGAFLALDGSTQRTLGQQFWLYYNASDSPAGGGTVDRNASDLICRRLVTVA